MPESPLIKCPHCFNGYTTPKGRRKCLTCGGDGYLIPGRNKKIESQPYPPIEEFDARAAQTKLNRTADRLEQGLCTRCGDEPLLTNTLGARCAEAVRTSSRKSRDRDKPDALIG